MALVVAGDDLEPDQKLNNPRSKPGSAHTDFIKSSKDTPNAPSAYLVEHAPGRLSSVHYHEHDQFQIVVNGSGKIGRHEMTPYTVHFARAHTPYGPLQADASTGWAFMTLRARYDAGAQHLPAALAKLKQVTDRQPWQISQKVEFPSSGSGVAMHDIPGIRDTQGLFACALTLAPNAEMTAPAAAGGDGQFILVVKGSLLHDHRQCNAMAVIYVSAEESSYTLRAGAQGLEALILNFPRLRTKAAAGFRRWMCIPCGYIYDEALGVPEEGIPAGTRWEDVPELWTCPDCAMGKADFELVETV
jgi:rubredoxin